MTAIVYRKLPDVPHRQYVRRIIPACNGLLWHRDRAIALPMPRDDAKTLADALWLSSRPRVRPDRAALPTQPAGEYGIEHLEDVTP